MRKKKINVEKDNQSQLEEQQKLYQEEQNNYQAYLAYLDDIKNQALFEKEQNKKIFMDKSVNEALLLLYESIKNIEEKIEKIESRLYELEDTVEYKVKKISDTRYPECY